MLLSARLGTAWVGSSDLMQDKTNIVSDSFYVVTVQNKSFNPRLRPELVSGAAAPATCLPH